MVSFCYRLIQTIDFSHRSVVCRIGRNNIDAVSIMLDAIENCFRKRTVIATELIIPAVCSVL